MTGKQNKIGNQTFCPAFRSVGRSVGRPVGPRCGPINLVGAGPPYSILLLVAGRRCLLSRLFLSLPRPVELDILRQ